MRTDPQSEIIQRLRCAAGHLSAVIEMAENNEPCENVLHQLSAVEAALHAAGFKLLTRHVHQSEAAILSSPSAAQRAAELKRLQALYGILIQKSDRYNEVTK